MASTRDIVPSSTARKEFGSYLREFRECGEQGEHRGEIYLGSYRRPEAVIIEAGRWERIMDLLDDFDAHAQVEERMRNDSGERIEFDDVARDLGFDPAEFDRE